MWNVDARSFARSRLVEGVDERVIASLLASVEANDTLAHMAKAKVKTRPPAKAKAKAKPRPTLRRARAKQSQADRVVTAAAADKLVGKKWFGGYTDQVSIVERPVLTDFDGQARGDGGGGAEYVVFEGGLEVRGPLVVGNCRSIYIVHGDLLAGSIVAGDAVFVVTGKVTVRDSLVRLRNEGIFLDGKEEPPAIKCPLLLWYDRNARELTLVRDGTRTVGEREIAELLAPAYSELDMDERRLKPRKILTAIAAGEPIFKA